MANVSCTSEEYLLRSYTSLARFFHEKRFDRVAHLSYDSQLNDLDVDPSKIELSVTKIKIRERPEARVFGASCPKDPYASGYKGDCQPLNMTDNEVSESVWHLASRIDSETCQNQLVEVFCAYQFNPKGFCVPPNYVIESSEDDITFGPELYPARGSRPISTIPESNEVTFRS